MLGLGNTLSGGIVPAAVASFANEYSLSFDGTNDYVDIGDVTILDGKTEFTISFWINFISLPGAFGAAEKIISKGNAYEIAIHNINSSGGGPGVSVPGTLAISGYTLSTSTWYHMAVTMVSAGFNIYINGALESTADQGSGVTIGNYNTPLCIGAKNLVGSSPEGFANAIIDEVAIFDATRDLSEIQAIYNGGTPTDLSDEDDLVGYWRMEENTGTTVADSSSSSNTGTFGNTPTWSSTVPS